MRYIAVLLIAFTISTICKSQSSPNTPDPNAALAAKTVPANTPNANPVPALAVQTPPQVQSTLTTDEAIRIARTELERDAYKQVIEASQKSIDNTKCLFTYTFTAIGLILTAIGIILALFGFAAYKETKKYEEATAKAKKACEDAQKYEQQAKGIFDDVSKQATATLEKIKDEGKKQIRELIAEAETERKISELSNDAFRLYNEGKYKDVCDKCAEILKLKPDNYWAYNIWGNALAELAKSKGDEKLFEQACQKFEQAIKLKSDMHEAYFNWGYTLVDWGELKHNTKLLEEACRKYEEAIKFKPDYDRAFANWGFALTKLAALTGSEKLFEEALTKYAKAIEIKPDAPIPYAGWSSVLLYRARPKIGSPEYESLLTQAEEKCLKAESLKKGSGAYNLACVYALRGDKEGCKKWLLTGQEAGTLVTREHAMKDSDLASVRDEDWFKNLKWKGEK